jgi:hypothetical protein
MLVVVSHFASSLDIPAIIPAYGAPSGTKALCTEGSRLVAQGLTACGRMIYSSHYEDERLTLRIYSLHYEDERLTLRGFKLAPGG